MVSQTIVNLNTAIHNRVIKLLAGEHRGALVDLVSATALSRNACRRKALTSPLSTRWLVTSVRLASM